MTQLPYDAVADMVAGVEDETVRDNTAPVKPEAPLHALADTVAEVEG